MTTEMTIEDKIENIKRLLDSDDASLKLPNGTSKESFIEYANKIISQARELLNPNGIENLKDEEKIEAYATLHSSLDGILNCFLEYNPSVASHKM